MKFSNNTVCVPAATSRIRNLQAATNITTVNMTYTVCAVQDLLCSNDVSGTTGFSTLFTTFMNDLKSAKNIQSSININSVPILNVLLVTDSAAPLLTQLTTPVSLQTTTQGTYSVTVMASSTSLWCYYMVAPTSQTITVANIKSCSVGTTQWCGSLLLSINQQVALTNPANSPAFTAGVSYNLNYFCYNKVVNPQFPSAISQWGSFTIPIPPPTTCPYIMYANVPDSNGICWCNASDKSGIVQQNATGTNCPGSFLKVSLISLFGLLVFLLLN